MNAVVNAEVSAELRTEDVVPAAIVELDALEFALVGGGTGAVIFG